VNAIDRLVAIEEIKQLKARYFRFLDLKDDEGFLSQFTSDLHMVEDVDGNNTVMEVHSRDELKVFLEGLAQARAIGFSVHNGHSPEIEIVDDRNAIGVWAMSDYIRMPGINMIGYGYYHERYRKGEDGVWRICSSRCERLHVDQLENATA
jgi:hypothetical protein